MTVRLGFAAAAAAAACAAAVVIAAPDDPSGPPSGRVTLVDFQPPSFPLALQPAPVGLTPHFSAEPGASNAVYSAAGSDDRIVIGVTARKPTFVNPSDTQDVTVAGNAAELVTEHEFFSIPGGGSEVRPQAALSIAWSSGRWVLLNGEGRFNDRDQLLAVAGTLVERPQPVPLQVHLAPAGWSVQAYKDDRILTLVNDADVRQTLSVHLPDQPIPASRLLHELQGPPAGPVIDVNVNGRPAQLVRVPVHDAADNGWYLQAQFAGGKTFVIQAPAAFTRQQVLAFASQVSYTP
ncbi:hypothetical protein HC031_17925 [Planosporangium thailandense]|uniref:Uncharacterized protein n=1 Tax=Planosporangium thailandense TaxID=765197 RepID=A0ABX0Y0L4_9ACTN|nr:hypothetical protein [Planosporangium thailandense]NJC71583.1 hypothetical protein [Planosporangium thailandense]